MSKYKPPIPKIWKSARGWFCMSEHAEGCFGSRSVFGHADSARNAYLEWKHMFIRDYGHLFETPGDYETPASNTEEPTVQERITAYLANGGLFNPEMANQDAVRDLLIDARDRINELEQESK